MEIKCVWGISRTSSKFLAYMAGGLLVGVEDLVVPDVSSAADTVMDLVRVCSIFISRYSYIRCWMLSKCRQVLLTAKTDTSPCKVLNGDVCSHRQVVVGHDDMHVFYRQLVGLWIQLSPSWHWVLGVLH